MTSIPLGEAKDRLSALVEQAARTHDRIEITVHGQRRAVLIGADDLDGLIETLEILSDPQTVAAIAEGEAAAAAGRVYSLEQVREEFEQRRRGK